MSSPGLFPKCIQIVYSPRIQSKSFVIYSELNSQYQCEHKREHKRKYVNNDLYFTTIDFKSQYSCSSSINSGTVSKGQRGRQGCRSKRQSFCPRRKSFFHHTYSSGKYLSHRRDLLLVCLLRENAAKLVRMSALLFT